MAVSCREFLNGIKNYTPAKTLESIKRELGLENIIKLAGNENNYGCSPLAKKAVEEALGNISWYPDMNCTQLREKLAEDLRVRSEQIIFGNGSFELLSLIAQTFINEGDECVIPVPSFGWYNVVTLGMGGKAVSVPLAEHKVDLDEVKAKVTSKTKIIWLCNPNNPTGTFFNETSLLKLLDEISDNILVVLDEAYYEYVNESSFPDSVSLISKYPNIVVLRTFSKVYGLASMRIGYGIADAELKSKLEKIKPPINVNMPAQAAALASLNDTEFKRYIVDSNEKSRQRYYEVLSRLNVEYIPTQCNFIMFKTGLDSSYAVDEFLKKGILVRGGTEFGMPQWLRVSIGRSEENEQVFEILKEIIQR